MERLIAILNHWKQEITLYYSITKSFTDRIIRCCKIIVTLMEIWMLKDVQKENFHRLANWKVNHCLCGQELNISVREFREQASGLCIICHFSFRHSLQTLVTGLKILPLSMIFQSRVYGIAGLLSFKPQMYPDSFVLHKHTNENQYYLQNLNMQ